jgi:hypothetical protein
MKYKTSKKFLTVMHMRCRDCKYYKPIDDEKGDCFGHIVPGDMPAEKCPAKAFVPKEKD